MKNLTWYKIKEINRKDYLIAIKPLYDSLNRVTNTNDNKQEDVFSKLILTKFNNWNAKQWMQHERTRKLHHNFQMKIGNFHEQIAGSFKHYINLKTGHISECDVINENETEIYEIKNKQNTINSATLRDVVRKLTFQINSGKKAFLVMINMWGKINISNSEITVLNGKQFYAKLSGRDDFHDDLLSTLSFTFSNFTSFEECCDEINKE